ncbi:MAG: hypothetical protein HN558_08850 [Gemmatimonadetes bacterium]|nr:hypothetical protein [Gemmatimonadota bacterium]
MGRNVPGLIAFWPDSIIPIAIVKWERRLLETEGREPLDGGERLLRAEVTEIVADCPGPGRGARLPTGSRLVHCEQPEAAAVAV